MKRLAVFLFLYVVALAGASHALDREWPPQADPVRDPAVPGNAQPNAAIDLRQGKIAVNLPSAFSYWLGHSHMFHVQTNPWGIWPVMTTVGDVHGVDDGETNVVINVANDVVMVCDLDINWTNKTATATPLYAWKTPNCPADPSVPHGDEIQSCNAVIWDFDQDGKNEIAVVAAESKNGTTYNRRLYLLSEPDDYQNPANGWFATGIPMADKDAQTASTYAYVDDQHYADLAERIGICRVRNTVMNGDPSLPYSADLWTSGHDGQGFSVWKIERNPTWSITRPYYSGYALTLKTHEFNVADIDGDGYDEFMMGGVRDFTDNGTALNGTGGIVRWATGIGTVGHQNRMCAADFDPANPGLEIVSTPELFTGGGGVTTWYAASDPGQTRPLGTYNVMWDANGNVMRYDEDRATSDPPGWESGFDVPDSLYVGNFTKDDPIAGSLGMEMIFMPQGRIGGLEDGNWSITIGSFTVTCDNPGVFTLAAIDGGYWRDVKDAGSPTFPNNIPGLRASGPIGPDRLCQIDWDGDRYADEILNQTNCAVYLWRLGRKGDWGETPPAWMPTESQLQSGWTEAPNTQYTRYWHYYQGETGAKKGSWAWSYDGPGRGTHYYEKLGEDWTFSYTAWPLDLGNDYREEIVGVSGMGKILVYYNPNPPATPAGVTYYSLNDPNPLGLPDRYDPANRKYLLSCYEYRKIRNQCGMGLTAPFKYLIDAPPDSNFTALPSSGLNPLTVQFTDASTGDVTEWHWDFGDGRFSTETSPAHTYTSEGAYTATLTVWNGGGPDTTPHTQVITVKPVADFIVSPSTTGEANVTQFAFTNQSTPGATTWDWDFGDGSTSGVENPTHTYSAFGTYTVTLKVRKNGAWSDPKTEYITVLPQPPVSSFNPSPTQGNVPLQVQFTDMSTGGATGWAWSFGDGGTATGQGPHQYTYNNVGTYTASLTASNSGGADATPYTQAITVKPVADFIVSPSQSGEAQTSFTTGTIFTFTDQSTAGATAWEWDFGDGGTSTAPSPTHTYTAFGKYTVKLTVTVNGVDSDMKVKTNYMKIAETFRFYSGMDEDGYMVESSEGSGVADTMNKINGQMYVGDTRFNEEIRSIISFETGGLPDIGTITSAVITLKKGTLYAGQDPFTANPSLGACNLAVRNTLPPDWDPSNGWFSGVKTLEVADFAADADRLYTNPVSAPDTGGVSTTSLVGFYGQLNRAGTTQFRLWFDNDSGDSHDDYISFYTSNNGTEDNWPKLMVSMRPN